jgi:hypothetical protein
MSMIHIANRSGASFLRGPKAVLAVLGAVAGLLLAAVAALFAAATVVVVAVIGTTLLGLAALTGRLRRAPVPAASTSGEAGEVIEARRVGGHEWVAYGWSDKDGPER